MYEVLKKYDLDLSRMEDEALGVLSQECAFRPATDVLLLRYYEPINKLIALKAKSTLLAADVQDAQQEGVFAILNAIARYDTLEAAKPHGCRFRTYLHMVVTCRFLDYVRHGGTETQVRPSPTGKIRRAGRSVCNDDPGSGQCHG